MRTVWITLFWVFTHVIYKSHSITFEIVNMPHLFTVHGLFGAFIIELRTEFIQYTESFC